MSFKKWADEYALNCEPNYSEETRKDCLAAFKAGQQSKQDEIDELQKRIDEALKFAIDAHSDLNIGMLMMVDILKGDQS